MSTTDPWTVGRLLQWTTDYLKTHGSDSPRLDAEVLLAAALGRQRIELYATFDEVPGDEARAAFRESVRRRAEGMPVAYLVGQREFYSLPFRVTPDVLIPRPETEFLVLTTLDLAKPLSHPAAIADVGTGSGIVAVCLAKHLPNCRVTAVDISPAALQVAEENAQRHKAAEQITFIESDLFANVPTDASFDFIVSNPPYITSAEMNALAVDVRKYEPRLALEAGPLGTEIIERLVVQSAERLTSGGHLLMEISPTIHDRVQTILESHPLLEPGPTVKDLARLPRIVQARKK